MEKFKKTGFIGAGKAGFSLGRYFTECQADVSGYYSQNPKSAMEAANFTRSEFFESIEELIRKSEVIFITVPDGNISMVWEQLRHQQIQGKIVCHCSGALSSEIFSDIDRCQAYGYSIHPLFAINDRYHSYKELSKCFVTIEGPKKYQNYFQTFFEAMGNPVRFISKEEKVRYHTAAAMASNLAVALVRVCQKQLINCGFTAEDAGRALAPILRSNMEHIINEGCWQALTGPLERCDVETVTGHLECLEGNERIIYRSLSMEVLELARKKNPDRDYQKMEEVLCRTEIQ